MANNAHLSPYIFQVLPWYRSLAIALSSDPAYFDESLPEHGILVELWVHSYIVTSTHHGIDLRWMEDGNNRLSQATATIDPVSLCLTTPGGTSYSELAMFLTASLPQPIRLSPSFPFKRGTDDEVSSLLGPTFEALHNKDFSVAADLMIDMSSLLGDDDSNPMRWAEAGAFHLCVEVMRAN